MKDYSRKIAYYTGLVAEAKESPETHHKVAFYLSKLKYFTTRQMEAIKEERELLPTYHQTTV